MASEALFTLPAAAAGELVAFRWCSYDVPFWSRDNTRPGRWHCLGDEPTQYWSLTPEASWAELIRQQQLQSEAELELVRMPFWACRVSVNALVDFRTHDARQDYGVTEGDLVDQNWGACQGLRRRLTAGLARGVIAPSAALPSHANVTLFGPRRAIGWGREPALSSTIPATQVALGRPPEGLLEQVIVGASQTQTLF